MENCNGMGRSRRHLHHRCSECFDLVEAQMGSGVHHEVHRSTDDWGFAAAEVVEELHEAPLVVEEGCRVVQLETELMMARQSRCHRHSILVRVP